MMFWKRVGNGKGEKMGSCSIIKDKTGRFTVGEDDVKRRINQDVSWEVVLEGRWEYDGREGGGNL